jgi:hypothetical protein
MPDMKPGMLIIKSTPLEICYPNDAAHKRRYGDGTE